MKAVVVHSAGDLRLEDRQDPACPAGSVIVDVEYGGICGSDLHYVSHGASGLSILADPIILGHEVAGRISMLGKGVKGFGVGDAVTVHPAVYCRECTDCLAGRTNLCPQVTYFGSAAHWPHTDGAFVSRKAVPAGQLLRLPAGVSTRQAAVAEPLAVAIHAVKRAGSLDGRDVLVNGAGPIGALVVAAARRAGAATIVASDLSETSLAIAKRMGADDVVLVGSGAVLPEVDVAFEASGAARAIGGVLAAVRRGGTVVQVGNLPAGPVTAELAALVFREIDYRGTFRFADEMDDALAYLADGLDVEPLLTHTFDAGDVMEAFAVAADRGTGSSKVLLSFI
ncbi:alcohol dehydrogenase catalytic domain-containing protein (plasmid) [Pseudarthrobacter psychrotolerans]|uniref:Alcohol dehydrogenase catalytic domain-containing protein n=1 Tax=Pseudarthrobacter psychrotolerans TaxID=2697569 RepID=A0A6P1NW57_9MICC|nr:L-idonate 5-dehydrogenase [Pseudarthrobacter psychrotolerans]QHK22630.1 alcohol dehydrogenase catalytic domain-containing protein [Pseudarthrobacter psychrotolerans]